jgi:hypothetical protein
MSGHYVCFSTSSAVASVAVFDPSMKLIFEGSSVTAHNASGTCLALLYQSGVDLSLVTHFLADLGPGSFSGVRVGVVLAKSFAFTNAAMGIESICGGATAFDLIDAGQTVVLPSKKGEYFVRRPNEQPYRTSILPEESFVGFGPNVQPEVHPRAFNFFELLPKMNWQFPEEFAPEYLIEPSISIPKKRLSIVENQP